MLVNMRDWSLKVNCNANKFFAHMKAYWSERYAISIIFLLFA